MMPCTEFLAILPDYLEPHALRSADRAAADAHVAGCAECASVVADLRTIVRDAGDLPVLTPGRDLWSGIETRIEAPVVALPTRGDVERHEVPALPVTESPAADPRMPVRAPSWRRLAIAASALVAVTAGITYSVASRSAGGNGLQLSAVPAATATVATPAAPVAPVASGTVRAVARPGVTETFDREIALLRKLVDDRRGDMDPITVGVVEKNLKLIDQAIAESKAALANDPASAFLMDRLTQAYGSKLQLMRELATRPPRS